MEDVLQAPLTGCSVQSFDQVLMNAECNGQTLTVLPSAVRTAASCSYRRWRMCKTGPS